jgi:type VI secretion system protein VasJ
LGHGMTFSTKLAAHYLAVAKSPITATCFAGDDVRYAAEYEVLEQELAKATSVHTAGTVDWEVIREGSESLLATQTKDLRIATWLSWSLYQRDSFAGLHAGLAMLSCFCRNHWDDIHPLKARTHAAAVTWLVPRMEQVLADHVPMGEQLPLFEQIALELRSLEGCLSAHLGAQAPLLLPLCRRLDDMVKRAGAAHPQPGAVGAAIAQVKQAAAQVFTATTPIDHEKDAHKSLRGLQDQARPLCGWWLKQKATDIKPLRLARTLLWLPIDSLPERNAEQITALRGVPADKLASYRERFSQGLYADLLADLEASIARAPFWLDGQRLAWECLNELDAEQAMREVEIQLALFLQRMAGLDELRFHDGTPFAGGETRSWLSARVMPHVQPAQAPSESLANQSGATPAWEEALQGLREPEPYVALKTLSEDFAGYPDAHALLYTEFALTARLSHRHVVRLFGFDVDAASQRAFITLELLNGPTLDQLLSERPEGLDWDELRDLALPLLDALNYSHSRGVIHGDLKPSNVMLADDGLRLFDYGLGQPLEGVLAGLPRLARSRFNAWTPRYAALELVEGREPSIATDLYALGCLLYELANGSHPFRRLSARQAKALELDNQLQRPPKLPAHCWPALRNALSFDQAQRQVSLAQLQELFRRPTPSRLQRWFGRTHG